MTVLEKWWQDEQILNDILGHIRSSKLRSDDIDCCNDLCSALNKAWEHHFRHRERMNVLTETEANNEQSDNQAVVELIKALPDTDISAFLGSEHLGEFVHLEPQIMNHKTLRSHHYDPANIDAQLRKSASEEHKELLNAYKRYSGGPNQETQKAVLKKLATLLYIVRSNIAHGEKTPNGPDHVKAERDRAVSKVATRVIEDFFDYLFDHPSRRLAVYGTLAPEQPNASELDEIDGNWQEGSVRGSLTWRDGLSEFRWKSPSDDIPVRVLEAEELKNRFPGIDRFEGSAYRRILVPVKMSYGWIVSNIYEAVSCSPK